MAHAPGVGYSSTKPGATGFKKSVPASAPASSTSQTAPAATTPQASSDGWSVSLPTFDDVSGAIPGGSGLEKVLVVIGILVLGMAIFSQKTGKTVSLGLGGLNTRQPISPAVQQSQAPLSSKMLQRTAAINPAKVGG